MKRNIKVRGRNGSIREVDDHYILQDGEAMLVEMPFMDAMGRTVIHDGLGNPAGQRPGFLYSDGNDQAEQARVDAYREYDKAIQQRWCEPQRQPSKQTAPEQQTFVSPEAALAAAYAEYDRTIQERWRK